MGRDKLAGVAAAPETVTKVNAVIAIHTLAIFRYSYSYKNDKDDSLGNKLSPTKSPF
jgi:hypothetical protein